MFWGYHHLRKHPYQRGDWNIQYSTSFASVWNKFYRFSIFNVYISVHFLLGLISCLPFLRDENTANCFSYSGSKKLQDLSWDGSHVPQQWRNPVVKKIVASDIPKICWINFPSFFIVSQHHVTTILNKALEMCRAIKRQRLASTKKHVIFILGSMSSISQNWSSKARTDGFRISGVAKLKKSFFFTFYHFFPLFSTFYHFFSL